ncbi:MAG: quinone oxidoreductase family protein [Acidimicrobiales bacterium]
MAERTVRAARLVAHGAPLRVDEIELAPSGDGQGARQQIDEVVVEMALAGVNPVDRYICLGRVAPDARLPRTVGVEGVGTLEGKIVAVHGTGLATLRDGVWSSAALLPRGATVPVPDGVDLRSAASIGVAGATAWKTVHELAEVQADDRVLVLGASGGVGHMIVSLARSNGAVVWGQTGNVKKAAAIEAGGAARAVVVDDPGALCAALRELRPTVVFDPLGGGYTGAAVDALELRGRLVLFGTSAHTHGTVPLQALYRKGIAVLGYSGLAESPESVHEGMRRALDAVRDGRLEVAVDEVMALEEVNDALARLERREVEGKILLSLAD